MPNQPILELKNVSSGYGSIDALKGVSLKVFPGEIVTMIGANGAGKTTTLMTICGIVPIKAGEIYYDGKPIHGCEPDTLAPKGLCQVPEGRRIFPRLKVEDNLEMGAFFRKDRQNMEKDMDHVFDLFPVLKERRKQLGGTLSGGEQQMLAIGRALMSKPRLLLLDEPSLGLAPLIVKRIFEIIHEINHREKTTILLVEQNANIALQSASRGYVLETGIIIMSDDAGALLQNPKIRKAYLGE
ncbi:MAG: ABC transporter ATP-binding protein [Desulfobacteraceae bacterium]|nr:MAG: ABC transporter ATP-binding protein [Desulfobacteraceae bacterium]